VINGTVEVSCRSRSVVDACAYASLMCSQTCRQFGTKAGKVIGTICACPLVFDVAMLEEWRFIIQHAVQAGVFMAPGRSDTGVMHAGDAGFAPRGAGHYLRCCAGPALTTLNVSFSA